MLPAALVAVAGVLLEVCAASPVYNMQPAFITNSVGLTTGRNIRHLPCISRRNYNQSGVCMFAIDCLKANGTHLGTCIDRFYFGSCCHMPVHEAAEDTIENDIIPQREPPMRLASTTKRTPTTMGPPQLAIFGDKKPTRGSATTTTTTTTTTTSTTTTTTTPPPTTALPERLQTFQMVEDNTAPERLQTFQSVESSTAAETTTSAPTTTTTTTTTTRKPTTTTTATPSTTTVRSTSKRPPTSKPSGTNGTTAATIFTTTAFINIRTKPPKPSTTVRPSKPTSKPTRTTGKPVRTTVGTTKKPVTTKSPVAATSTTRRPVNTFRTTTTRRPVVTTTTARTTTTRRPTATSGGSTSKRPVTTRRPSTTTTRRPVTAGTRPIASKGTTRRPVATARPGTSTTTERPTEGTATTTRRPVTTARPGTSTTTGRPIDGTATTTRRPVATARPAVTTTERPATTTTGALVVTAASGTATSTPRPVAGTPTPVSNEVPQGNVTTILDSINGNVATNEIESGRPGTTASPEGVGVWQVDDRKNYTTPAFNETTNTTTEDWVPITSPDAWVLLPSVSPSTAEVPTSTPTTTTTTTTPAPSSTTSAPTSEEPRPPEGFFPVETTPGQSNLTTEVPPTTTAVPSKRPLNMSDYTDVCGRRMYPQAKIVGGEKSMFGRWPWQISVRQWRTSTYLHKCGAALLNENWAITAAHCVDSVPPSDLLLRLGEYDLSTESEPYLHQERRVQIIASHPQFDQRTFEYDLALLRFYEPVTFQPNILPVCVPATDENFIGRTAHVTGWGRLYEDGPLPSVLQEVSVPVLNNSVCENMYESAGYIEHIPHIFICAGWRRGGYDSCEGDSGGPMVIQREDRRFVLAGIISWGIGCAEPNQPGVYTRVSEFRDWINQILQF